MPIEEGKLADRWRLLKAERISKPQRLRIIAAEFSCSQKEVQTQITDLGLWYDSNETKAAIKGKTTKKFAPSEKKTLADYSNEDAIKIGERYLREKWKIYKDEGYFLKFADDKLRLQNQARIEKIAKANQKALAVEFGLSGEDFEILLDNVEANRPAISAHWRELVQKLRSEADDRVREIEWSRKTGPEKVVERGKNYLIISCILAPIILYFVYAYSRGNEKDQFEDCLERYRNGYITDPSVCIP